MENIIRYNPYKQKLLRFLSMQKDSETKKFENCCPGCNATAIDTRRPAQSKGVYILAPITNQIHIYGICPGTSGEDGQKGAISFLFNHT